MPAITVSSWTNAVRAVGPLARRQDVAQFVNVEANPTVSIEEVQAEDALDTNQSHRAIDPNLQSGNGLTSEYSRY